MSRKRLLRLGFALLASAQMPCAPGQDSLFAPAEPQTVFSGGAEYLFSIRGRDFRRPGPLIAGPDTDSVGFRNTDFDFESGVRAFVAASGNFARVEAIYSNYGPWMSHDASSLTAGLSFDEGIFADWTGANFINTTVGGFQSLHGAAAGGMGGETDEDEGLGPSGTFGGDAFPLLDVRYRSLMQTWELNLVTEDPDARFQLGLGYRYLELEELSNISLTGTLRAVDIAVPNGGLSHAALTTFGGLSHTGGVADGFQDETSNVSGFADTLQMIQQARASNDLNGMQLIFSEQIMYWRGWTIDGIVKPGLYHNHVRATVMERYVGTDPVPGGSSSEYTRVFSDSKSQVAFAGVLGLRSCFPLSDHWSFVSGYEFTWVYGVALAPEQYAAVTGPTLADRALRVESTSDIIVHAGSLGLQFTY